VRPRQQPFERLIVVRLCPRRLILRHRPLLSRPFKAPWTRRGQR
jgi:hypothetical protein